MSPAADRDRRLIGQRAEDAAAAFLQAHGCSILMRNFRRRTGEIDIVARDGPVLVIAEVRTRSREDFGGAAASVDGFKRRRIVRTALQLLQAEPPLAQLPVRFDVLVVHEMRPGETKPDESHGGATVEWLRHAFDI